MRKPRKTAPSRRPVRRSWAGDDVSTQVEIVPYDSSWPERFGAERTLLAGIVNGRGCGPIEHIGSTSIPGMPAKPIIDIMIGVRDLASSRDIIATLAVLEYCYYPYRADCMHWFCKPSPELRTHHLHLVPVGSRTWIEQLTFRDYLRANAHVASEYAALKHALAQRHRYDREAYTQAKAPFIARTLELASSRAMQEIGS